GGGAKLGVVEQGLERLTRPFVGGIEKEYLAVVFQGRSSIVEVLLWRATEAKLEIDELALGQLEVEAPAQNVDVGVVFLEVAVENVERLERARVGRLVFQDGAVGRHRALGVLDLAF